MYAQLMRSRPMQEDADGRFSPASARGPAHRHRTIADGFAGPLTSAMAPTDSKRFRYDGLMDAVNYARPTRQRQDKD